MSGIFLISLPAINLFLSNSPKLEKRSLISFVKVLTTAFFSPPVCFTISLAILSVSLAKSPIFCSPCFAKTAKALSPPFQISKNFPPRAPSAVKEFTILPICD
jgi:hypothetical protein